MTASGLMVGSIVFGSVGVLGLIIGLILTSRGNISNEMKSENRKLFSVVFLMAVFCMWIHWACAYMHQMNPLVQPIAEQSHG